MKKIEVKSDFAIYESIGELPDDEQNLMNSALGAAKGAYAPYSGFFIGAAVLLKNQKVIVGSNQENASFSNTLCAERVAIFSAGANFPNQPIEKIAIAAIAENFELNKPVAPCGACRQAIAEVEMRFKQPVKVLFGLEKSEIYSASSIKQLLPLLFYEEGLKRH